MDRSHISYLYGVQAMFSGSAGAVVAGLLADWIERKGFKDGKLRVAIGGTLCMLPVALAFPLMPNYVLSYCFVVLLTFFTSFPYGPAVAALQVVTPNDMRGVVTGLYLFVANVLGLALGPLIIGFYTDFVFVDELKIKYSIILAALTVIPLSTLFLVNCLRAYREALGRTRLWAER